jgi:hypothetical protein
MPPRRRFQLQGVPTPDRQELLPVELNGRNYDLIFDPRCRVCRLGSDGVLLVNRMLTEGFTYSDIAKQVRNVNIPNGPHRLTTAQIQDHWEKHLPAKNAAVRTIIEARAAQMQEDFVEGTQNLLSPYVYAKVMMDRAYYDMVDNNMPISPKEGIEAAKLLHQFEKEEANSSDMAEAMAQLNRIIGAVRDIVPAEMFSKIIDRVQNPNGSITVEARNVPDEDDEDDYDDEEKEYEEFSLDDLVEDDTTPESTVDEVS